MAEWQVWNISRTGLPMFAAFSGRCARTPGLALCPWRLTEGGQFFQFDCKYLFVSVVKFRELDYVAGRRDSGMVFFVRGFFFSTTG